MVGPTLERTRFAVRTTLGRTDGRLAFGLVAAVYLPVYLFAIGDLAAGGVGAGVRVAADPLAVALRRTGPVAFDSVALVDLGVVTYEFSPLNLLVGVLVAGLVATNLAVSYVAWRQPTACGLSAGSGLLGAVPALLSGTACCGPVVLIAVGVPASAALVSLFNVLLPLAVGALLVSLLYVGRQVDPEAA